MTPWLFALLLFATPAASPVTLSPGIVEVEVLEVTEVDPAEAFAHDDVDDDTGIELTLRITSHNDEEMQFSHDSQARLIDGAGDEHRLVSDCATPETY